MREKSTAYLTVTFKDKNGAPATPTLVSYRVDCATTGASIRPPTDVPPASQVEITLTADENAILNDGNAVEVRCVTVVATYGADSDRLSEQFEYRIDNLRFLTT